MEDKDAHKVLRQMRDAAIDEVAYLERKLQKENAEFASDADPLTGRIIELTAARVTRRRLEAEALAIAVSKF